MKISLIPAQVTSVEDKITASLSLSQIIILICALINALVFYIILPPFLKFNLIKIIFIVLMNLFIAALSLRVGENILVDYLILRIKFYLRPRRYVFYRKALNEDINSEINQESTLILRPKVKNIATFGRTIHDLNLPKDKKLIFKVNKNGRLYVQISNI